VNQEGEIADHPNYFVFDLYLECAAYFAFNDYRTRGGAFVV